MSMSKKNTPQTLKEQKEAVMIQVKRRSKKPRGGLRTSDCKQLEKRFRASEQKFYKYAVRALRGRKQIQPARSSVISSCATIRKADPWKMKRVI